jgi:splicing factor 3B subunit 3
MHLLSNSIQKGTSITTSVYGNFSGSKMHEIVIARGSGIEMYRPDNTGSMISINYTPCFCVVRSLQVFRLLGSNTDYLVIGSDSGIITIVEYIAIKNTWKTLHSETFGKSGCRRIVPGQYLACDPKGRAILCAGIEKQRFVYVMNRDSGNNLTISSPLEAHRNNTILFSCVGLDVALDNPIFAMLELEYASFEGDSKGYTYENTEKKLTYYELDLGLNHVVRKWSEPVSRTANFLLSVPGGTDGPGGVLICGENWVSYKHQDANEVRTPVPRRNDFPTSRGILLISGTTHKQRGSFFFLIQSELGDLYKAVLVVDDNIVVDLHIICFDSIPPSINLCITRTGLLFAACEHGNQYLFQFLSLGNDDNSVCARSVDTECMLGDDVFGAVPVAPVFKPSDKLVNLVACDELNVLAPIVDMMIAPDVINGKESKEQKIHLLTGAGHRSSLRSLQHGSSVSELASSPLPSKAIAVWSLKNNLSETYDTHILVSFIASTIVLGVGNSIEEVQDSGFQLDTHTLAVGLLSNNSRVQIHPTGIRHIRPGGTIVEWKSPGGRIIDKACVNQCQVVISVAGSAGHGSELLVFELDDVGQLTEMGSVNMNTAICSLDITQVPDGRIRAPFVAVGCLDDTVQVLSLEANGDDILRQCSMVAMDSRPDALCFVNVMRNGEDSTALQLNIGLQTGVLHRVFVDQMSGAMTDSRQKFLGTRSVTLKKFNMIESGCGEGLLSLSSRSWLTYTHCGRQYHVPLCCDAADTVSSFHSEACPEGLIMTIGNNLRILSIDNIGSMFYQKSTNFMFTPRKIARTDDGLLVIIASDQHAFTKTERLEKNEVNTFLEAAVKGNFDGIHKDDVVEGEEIDVEDEDEDDSTTIPLRGPIPATEGKWASCVTVINSLTGESTELELTDNEAAFSLSVCSFSQQNQSAKTCIVVGTAVGLTLHPRSALQYYLNTYELDSNTRNLSLLHRTSVDELPLSMIQFNGRLLAGIGKKLRLYDLGLKQLLIKCESLDFPSTIARLDTHGNRVFIGDMSESVLIAKYKRVENTFIIFAEDYVPRWINSLCALDHHSVACSDKFGNVFVLRVAEHVDDDVDPVAGTRALWDTNGRAKLQQECHYYIGDMVTSIKKVQFIVGCSEVLVAATVSGELHVLMPITSKGDLDFFSSLEKYMQANYKPLCGRVHMSYRSYYQPVRHTIDGDYCEQFIQLSYNQKLQFAEEQGRSVPEVIKKLQESREFM